MIDYYTCMANETTQFKVSLIVHERVKKACEGTGFKLQAFTERALVTYLEEHASDIKAEKERVLKYRSKE